METPNLSYIYNMSGGDTAFEKKIINIIKMEFSLEKEEYLKNFKAKNFKLTADNVHKLKHKISILGLDKSYEIASAFENDLLKGNTSLNQEFKSILINITNYLQQL